MLYRLFAVILLSSASCAVATAQQTTAPIERNGQRMIFTAPFESSYLGVQTQEITKENIAKFGLSAVQGVGIEKVVENSPAANAGLQNGDVIVRFEGEDVTSIRKLNRLISEVAPDHQARITILRGGGEREITVTIGKRELPQLRTGNFSLGTSQSLPSLPTMPVNPQILQSAPLPPFPQGDNNFIWRSDSSRQIGVSVEPLNKQLADYFGVAEGRGLLINNVRENSPAAKAGLKAGDVIIEAEGKEVKGMMDLVRAINEKKEGDVSLTIIRDKNRQTTRVTPEISKDGTVKIEQLFENNPNRMNFQFQSPQSPVAPAIQLKVAPRVL